jgi:hypothetical protein
VNMTRTGIWSRSSGVSAYSAVRKSGMGRSMGARSLPMVRFYVRQCVILT